MFSACIVFAEEPDKNYVEEVNQDVHPEQLQGYFLATAGYTTTRGEFTSGTTILELYLTNPKFSSWSWAVSPSNRFQGCFSGQWGGMLMSSSGLDNTTITITGNIIGVGTRTKVLVIRESYY